MSKEYLFKFSDGHEIMLGDTAAQYIREYCDKFQCELTYSGWMEHIKNLQMPNLTKIGGDGFKEGYNPGLGCYVNSRKHQRQLLKEKGLVEVGKEKPKQNWADRPKYFSHEDKKKLKRDTDISDVSLDSLKD